jgi:hypothetical protein
VKVGLAGAFLILALRFMGVFLTNTLGGRGKGLLMDGGLTLTFTLVDHLNDISILSPAVYPP